MDTNDKQNRENDSLKKHLSENLNQHNHSIPKSAHDKEQGMISRTQNSSNSPTPKEPIPAVKQEKKQDVNVAISREATIGEQSASKVMFARMPLIKLWFVLILTLGFTIVLLIASHLTHSLTLRIEAYHALYNLFTLAGCLFTIKICDRSSDLKNTFGWARVEILSCLCSLLFIASLCFSVTLESIQTAAHAGHQDPMHYPLYAIALGGLGLCLNAVVFFSIGGYTHHQGCFLERRSSGVWVQSSVTDDAVQAGKRTLLSHPLRQTGENSMGRSYQGAKGVLRDIVGLVIVMLCATIVEWDTEKTLALYIDPAFAVLSASLLLFLSYPYGKECCQILLQTIPANIDVQEFSAKILQEFPELINVHHLHIWSLTPGKVIATAHVVYSNPKVFHNSIGALEKFFQEKDITQVTLQPEFVHYSSSPQSMLGSSECLLQCTNNLCRNKECCANCLKDGQDLEEGNLQSPTEDNGANHFGVARIPDSRERIIYGDLHGTAAFRSSAMDLPTIVPVLRRVKSKEDVRQKMEPPTLLFRSYSFHLVPSDKNRRKFSESKTLLPSKPL